MIKLEKLSTLLPWMEEMLPQTEETLLAIHTQLHSIHKHSFKTTANNMTRELVSLDTIHGFINSHTRPWTQSMDTEVQMVPIMDGIHLTHIHSHQLMDHLELILLTHQLEEQHHLSKRSTRADITISTITKLKILEIMVLLKKFMVLLQLINQSFHNHGEELRRLIQ